ncbi:MAG: OmpA family protein [Flavobacteriales bacterium]|nr:OmpA family protein [Flavobacteriales bacterium]
MKFTLKLAVTAIAIFQFQGSFSQKAKEKLADTYFEADRIQDALILYKEVTEGSKKTEYAFQRLAECYVILMDYSQALVSYRNLIEFGTNNPQNYYEYSKVCRRNALYEESDKNLKKYYELANLAIVEIPQDYYENLKKDEALKEVTNWNLNSSSADFAPVKEGDRIYYVSGKNGLLSLEDSTEKFSIYTVSLISHDDKAQSVYSEMNINEQDGPVAFQPNGKVYVTTNRLYEGFKLNQLKLIELNNVGDDLSGGSQIPFNSDEYSVGHATFSPDGQTMYFVSNMPGSIGESDIWKTDLINGNWSKPINLGTEINTFDKELFPYISQNGDLYFASEGHLGLGGLDIFVAKKNGNSFEKPVNLGYPINTQYDDFSYTSGLENSSAYFSSNRPGGVGKDDIYKIYYKVEGKNDEVVVKTDAPKEIEIVKKIEEPKTNAVEAVEKFDPIYFKLNSSDLNEQDKLRLDHLADVMKKNPNLKVNIMGHADNQGTDKINMNYSVNRAKKAYLYLASKGVSSKQMSYTGFGETKPVNKCADDYNCSEEELAKNRRVEFTFTAL